MTQLLPGQAAAPTGPADMRMMYVLHHGFRRDLAKFTAAARHTPYDDASTWQRLRNRWNLFSTLLGDHHEKEDRVLWPVLRERAGHNEDHEALDVLAAMEAEHEQMDPLLASIEIAFQGQVEHPCVARAVELEGLLTKASSLIVAHLDHEERSAIAILQRYFSADEWADLERRKLRGGVSPAVAFVMLPWAVHDLPGDLVEDLRSDAGAMFRLMLRLGARRFERLERESFWHVPPGIGA